MTDSDIRKDRLGPLEHTKIKIHRRIQQGWYIDGQTYILETRLIFESLRIKLKPWGKRNNVGRKHRVKGR